MVCVFSEQRVWTAAFIDTEITKVKHKVNISTLLLWGINDERWAHFGRTIVDGCHGASLASTHKGSHPEQTSRGRHPDRRIITFPFHLTPPLGGDKNCIYAQFSFTYILVSCQWHLLEARVLLFAFCSVSLIDEFVTLLNDRWSRRCFNTKAETLHEKQTIFTIKT